MGSYLDGGDLIAGVRNSAYQLGTSTDGMSRVAQKDWRSLDTLSEAAWP